MQEKQLSVWRKGWDVQIILTIHTKSFTLEFSCLGSCNARKTTFSVEKRTGCANYLNYSHEIIHFEVQCSVTEIRMLGCAETPFLLAFLDSRILKTTKIMFSSKMVGVVLPASIQTK